MVMEKVILVVVILVAKISTDVVEIKEEIPRHNRIFLL